MRYLLLLLLPLLAISCLRPKAEVVEQNGYVRIEAENYASQTDFDVRSWIKTDKRKARHTLVDSDESHHITASGGAYLEALPDTRVTHDDKLIHGTNFSNEPGKMGILNYPIRFTTPGRYYVWVRAYSSGTEDNGIHVGLNGQWPESGQRMQWCEGKNKWTWASKQRTQEIHCGVEKLIYLDIPTAGKHTVSFSLREDGFEFDAFVLERDYINPDER